MFSSISPGRRRSFAQGLVALASILIGSIELAGCVGDDAAPSGASSGVDSGGGADVVVPPADDGGKDTGADAPLSCTAPATACGGVCADLMTSGDHCGACNHSCGGGVCNVGVCQVHTLATGIADLNAMSLDDTSVYFSAGNVVQRCPKKGPCTGIGLNKIADFTGANEDGTGALSAAAGRVVFVGNTNGDSRLYNCPGTGCGTLTSLGVSMSGYGPEIPIVGDQVYVHHPMVGMMSMTCSATGACSALVKRHDRALMARPIAASTSHYYFIKKEAGVLGGISRCPASEPTCATVEDLSSVVASPSKLLIQGNELFILWAGGQAGGSAMGHCLVTGCSGSFKVPAVIRSGVSIYADMTVEGADVFWFEAGRLSTCPIASCTTPRELATGITTGSHLVADKAFVYWLEGVNTPNGAVRRIAR